jgi:predicted glutamine amidotransferase
LLNVLQKHALTEGEEMSSSRLKAIEILLKKSLPDLAQVTLEGGEQPIGVQVVSSEPLTAEAWASKFQPLE